MPETTAMTQSRPRLLSAPGLPEELIVEILLKLPVSSLLRFRYVCKSWKALISCPKFAKNHLRISCSGTRLTHQRLVSFTSTNHGYCTVETCPVQPLFENPSSPPKTLSFSVRPSYRFIAGSCYGMVCLCDPDGCFRLLNPSNRLTSRKSPPADLKPLRNYGFGYDQVNDKYKVLIVIGGGFPFPKETKVHTFGTSSWTRIRNSQCPLTSEVGRFASGNLNWLAQKGDGSIKSLIVSFDLEKETYGQVLLPPHLDGDVLGVMNNCLCLCDFNGFHCDVWLMKEYGIQESWTKLISLPYGECIDHHFRPLCISENGVVLGRSKDLWLVMQNPHSDKFDCTKIEKRFGKNTYICHESLVSP